MQDTCIPSPCGPNSHCSNIRNQAVCSCLPGYYGNAPSCRPECYSPSDCLLSRTCINEKCVDPCAGSCGFDAECRVINHIAICSCPRYTTGDPYDRCIPITIHEPSRPQYVTDRPTRPSYVIGSTPRPTTSRPFVVVTELVTTSRPLPTAPRPYIIVTDSATHRPRPITITTRIPPTYLPGYDEPINPCVPSPCGAHSKCKVLNSSPSCSCLPDFRGIPPYCRPECQSNDECSYKLSCVNQKCVDPCINACGENAKCTISRHIPNCYCVQGTAGDPYRACHAQVQECKFFLLKTKNGK